MLEQRYSDNDQSRRDIPSFIEPRPPLISNPFMRPRPQKGTNLLELFEEDSESEEPELVKVYLRMKPASNVTNLYEVQSDQCLITSVDTATAGHGRRTQHNVSKMYTFSHIFRPDSTQKEIFEHVVKDNLRKLPDGHNFTLLTYGASGSGKTFTLMGTVASPGLVPRSLEYVFKVVDAAQQPLYKPSEGGAEKLSYAEQDYELQWVKKFKHVAQMASLKDRYRRMSSQLNHDFTTSSFDTSNRVRHYVWVSFVEIYNEAIYDLLEASDRRTMSKLRIREDSNGNVFVKGATQAFVRSGEEAYDVMVTGKHNLQVAATGVHAQSSRSHCIFTITMLTETESGVRASCVRLCDLAGCERARRTRNSGARMQESRAINSSLHVLERCLHMLRRNQRNRHLALVPYRESKLTRLLGAGLSGARGEAVSMVVTLNPAPEYQHETKHVLQLAAVARDIQVNNTIAESTLESSTQDTTIEPSVEVMRLRADNERLHFELVQAQARNKELSAAMEERQQEAANTMRELVEEAKDMTRQYYEAQIQALKDEMEDMAEEYESRLSKAATAAPPSSAGTPSRSLQNKVSQLMTEIAILEEKLTAERLARARAEEEVQHLRACIEERDEKAFEENSENPEDVVLTDSEHESEDESDDVCDESLEPTFKKEDINRSRMSILRQSLAIQQNSFNNTQHTMEDIGENDESVLEKSGNTLKDDSCNVTAKDSIYLTGEDSEVSKKTEESHNTDNDTKNDVDDTKNDVNDTKNYVNNTENGINDTKDDVIDTKNDVDSFEEPKAAVFDNRGTYFVNDDRSITEVTDIPVQKENSFPRGTYFVRESQFVDSAISEIENGTGEVIMKDISINEKEAVPKMDVTKETSINTEKVEVNTEVKNNIPEKDEINNDVKNNNTEKEEINEEVRNNYPIKEEINEKGKNNFPPETLVSKIIKSFKSNKNSDSSLAQFEQLEMAANTCDNDSPRESNHEFSNIKMLKEKRTYFDDNVKVVPIEEKIEVTNKKLNKTPIETINKPTGDITTEFLKVAKEKKTYFDNIDVNVDLKKTTELDRLKADEIRSPSIVKDDVTNDFEPSKIKKLLGESMTRPDKNPVIQVAKIKQKHESMDIFEGFDSPQIKIKEKLDTVELARKSIEKMVIEQKSKVDDEKPAVKETSKTENNSTNKDKITDTQTGTNIVNTADNVNNTVDDFENIYKDITAPRATEFELLISQSNINETQSSISEEIKTEVKIEPKQEKEEVKYNLRHKSIKAMDKSIEDKKDKIKNDDVEEILLESHAKCESKAKAPKRNLRLRRRKNQTEDVKSDQEGDKLKDIVNLQTEFSDVCMDLPVPKKEVKDIPSPERMEGSENIAPMMMGIQSCPSKSVTRSRRKLFTPRAEPLDESLSQTGDSNERVCVPRPSYHRARARRRL